MNETKADDQVLYGQGKVKTEPESYEEQRIMTAKDHHMICGMGLQSGNSSALALTKLSLVARGVDAVVPHVKAPVARGAGIFVYLSTTPAD